MSAITQLRISLLDYTKLIKLIIFMFLVIRIVTKVMVYCVNGHFRKKPSQFQGAGTNMYQWPLILEKSHFFIIIYAKLPEKTLFPHLPYWLYCILLIHLSLNCHVFYLIYMLKWRTFNYFHGKNKSFFIITTKNFGSTFQSQWWLQAVREHEERDGI